MHVVNYLPSLCVEMSSMGYFLGLDLYNVLQIAEDGQLKGMDCPL